VRDNEWILSCQRLDPVHDSAARRQQNVCVVILAHTVLHLGAIW